MFKDTRLKVCEENGEKKELLIWGVDLITFFKAAEWTIDLRYYYSHPPPQI